MSNDTKTHSAEFVYRAFCDIDQGRIPNAHFSHANVVMITGDRYAELLDALDELKEERNRD